MRLSGLLLFLTLASLVAAVWQANCTQNCTVNFLAPVVVECEPINCSIVCEQGDPEDFCHDRCEVLDTCEILCNQNNCTTEVPDCRNECTDDIECDDDGECTIECVDPICEFVIAPGAPVAVPVCDEPVCQAIFCEDTEETAAGTRGFSLF